MAVPRGAYSKRTALARPWGTQSRPASLSISLLHTSIQPCCSGGRRCWGLELTQGRRNSLMHVDKINHGSLGGICWCRGTGLSYSCAARDVRGRTQRTAVSVALDFMPSWSCAWLRVNSHLPSIVSPSFRIPVELVT